MTDAKRRTYLTLIGACLCALLVDRFVLDGSSSGPATADAAVVAKPEATADASAPAEIIPRIPFPNVTLIQDDRLPRDFFAATTDVDGDNAPANAADSSELRQDSTRQMTVAQFEKNCELIGVLVGHRGATAVVNGRQIAPGESIAGCELLNILGRSATFRCNDGEVTLLIATRGHTKRN